MAEKIEKKQGFLSNFHPIQKVENFIKTNEVLKTHKDNLKSIRIILTFLSACMWTIFSFKTFWFIRELLESVEIEQRATVVSALSDKVLMIFYMNSFIFLVMLLVYVLKRTDIKLEIGNLIKFETKGSINGGNSNVASQPAAVDPRTGEPIK